MLKIEVNKETVKISGSGTTEDMTIDLVRAINHLYNFLRRNQPESAEAFKMAMSMTVVTGAAFMDRNYGDKGEKLQETFTSIPIPKK